MHNPTSHILDARLRHAAFALASEHFQRLPPLTSLPSKMRTIRLFPRLTKLPSPFLNCRTHSQNNKWILESQPLPAGVAATGPQPIDHIAQDPLTDSSDVPDEPSRLPQIAPLPSPKLSSKTQENEYSSEANLTEDAYSVEGPVKCQEKQTISGDSGDVDHHLSESTSQVALDTLTQIIISSSPVAVVEHPKSQCDSTSATPSLPSTSKKAPVMGAAQVAALNAVSTSNGPAAVLPSSLVTLSTSSLGAAESPVPCTLGKRDLVAADEPVEGSSSASEEGGMLVVEIELDFAGTSLLAPTADSPLPSSCQDSNRRPCRCEGKHSEDGGISGALRDCPEDLRDEAKAVSSMGVDGVILCIMDQPVWGCYRESQILQSRKQGKHRIVPSVTKGGEEFKEKLVARSPLGPPDTHVEELKRWNDVEYWQKLVNQQEDMAMERCIRIPKSKGMHGWEREAVQHVCSRRDEMHDAVMLKTSRGGLHASIRRHERTTFEKRKLLRY
ncbi:hypothetical protein CPB85DRAFT_1470340 [Mucidula mucida]|nr:hypothetical protein CPB85DRAFT_1470340 [Mucidula mucida]